MLRGHRNVCITLTGLTTATEDCKLFIHFFRSSTFPPVHASIILSTVPFYSLLFYKYQLRDTVKLACYQFDFHDFPNYKLQYKISLNDIFLWALKTTLITVKIINLAFCFSQCLAFIFPETFNGVT